jgi:AcrR family transcriptional regulator
VSPAERDPAPPPAAPRTRPAASGDGPAHVGGHVGGRPRNTEIDRHVLEVALRHLRTVGLRGLSVAAVAEEAGTTRAAVYRRWSGRTELAVAALGTIDDGGPTPPSGDPFADLVAELGRFRRFVVEHDATALVAVALVEGTDPRVREQVRRRLVDPCRGRLRACLRAGVESGALRAQADHTTAEDLLTGSWLAHAARGETLAEDWAPRTAAMVWAGCGGVPVEHRPGGHAAPIE